MSDEQKDRINEAINEIVTDAVFTGDTEQGLELPEKVELNDEEKEFQAAIDASAEQRAKSPMEVACMQHARMYGPFVEGLEYISGGAAKRILRYLVGYPFFVDKLNPQDERVEGLAYIADKLGQAKSTILLIRAIEQEAAAQKSLAEHAAIQELNLEGNNETKEGE